MTNEKIQEAAEWLEQLFDDFTKEPAYEKSGEELMLRVQWEIEQYDPKLQRAVVEDGGGYDRSPPPSRPAGNLSREALVVL